MCDGRVAVIVGISLRPYRMTFSFAVANVDYMVEELWVNLMRCDQRRKTNAILSRQIKSPSRSMLSSIHRGVGGGQHNKETHARESLKYENVRLTTPLLE